MKFRVLVSSKGTRPGRATQPSRVWHDKFRVKVRGVCIGSSSLYSTTSKDRVATRGKEEALREDNKKLR